MKFTVSEIAQMLDGIIVGDEKVTIDSAAKIEEGRPGCISFLANSKYESYIYTTQSSAVIVNRDFTPKKDIAATLIYVDNAYSAFTILLEEYQKRIANIKQGVEQPSFIGDNSTVGVNGYRGAFSYIGKNCKIGDRVKIYPGAYLGDNVILGNDCCIHPGVRIYDNTVIGNNCNVFANTVIGSDGFGFAPQPDGSYKTIPQLGNVVLEDDVSIGANTTIDCATMGSTIIRKGAKVDNLVQIAHNVEVGSNTVIAAQSGVSGSTQIGERCVIAGQVGIVGHIFIANNTKIGAQSGLGKSIKKEGLSLSGSPARDLNEHLRTMAATRRLPEMEQRLKELELKRETSVIQERD
ncbi:UDP-3-O-(3-hydroxymyristoyl)glucosamine N-acyltransferase [Dyadobacter psychrotolerans]|uniref:UDP-3-O-acylglucosamine N-acyltransferase n=1 Tax=Dyadobacter psychrotolerans TaxID=2541721 RepID=A0A4R5DMN2_9BACT|nr:UDP-3-O-(3-hydroxymyristoyl)glucosamine N-acyltransferase [Dyadobacter psychrotolerans]TDE13310.1 UDP-3-O-(3-hydroxymyristoyl)glucosamine N-acyltransferase [Dyadobacter psychrotolerans]